MKKLVGLLLLFTGLNLYAQKERTTAPLKTDSSLHLKLVSPTISALVVCDIATTTDADTRNRVAQNIDLTAQNTEILKNLTNTRVAFYASQEHATNKTPEITDPTNFQNDPNKTILLDFNADAPGVQTIYYRTIDPQNTYSDVASFELKIHPEPNIPLHINNYVSCDTDSNGMGNDGDGIIKNIDFASKIPEILSKYPSAAQTKFSVSFHLNQADVQTGRNPLPTDIYTNSNNNQLIFVRVVNEETACVHSSLSFAIIINPLPTYNAITSKQVTCLNNLPLTLKIENPLINYQYRWTQNNIEISTSSSVNVITAGNYNVTITNPTTLCQRVETFEVIESEAATITAQNITVVDDLSSSNEPYFSMKIDTTGIGRGDYEFALADKTDTLLRDYQNLPFFDQLTGGFYNLWIRDKNGCDQNQIPTSIEVPIIAFPKFFTPNGDGINDTWTIKGLNTDFYPASEIFVYNRMGKIIAKVTLSKEEWDGTYNGKKLPADDYWFTVKLVPFDNTKKTIFKTGNFSLLRD